MEKTCIPVVGAILEKEDGGKKYILIQTRTKTGTEYDGHLEFPVGRLHERENVYDGLSREVFEETGLKITHINKKNIKDSDLSFGFSPRYCTQQKSHGLSRLMLGFVCKCAGELIPQEGETSNLRRVLVDDLTQIIKNEKIFALQKPFFEKYLEDNGNINFEII